MRTTGSTTRTPAIAKAARWQRWRGSGGSRGRAALTHDGLLRFARNDGYGRHRPRRRTIQYPRGRSYCAPSHDRRGVLGPPLSRRTTSMMLKPWPPKTKSRRCRRLSSIVISTARSVGGFERFRFLPGNRALDGRLHLLESTDLDLPHAFARHAEFGGEVFQRHRIFRQAPRLEDAAFARVEHADGAVQRLTAMIELLVLGHHGFLVGRVIDQPVLPFAGFTVVADRRVERRIAAEAAVHVDDVLIRHAEALGNDRHLVGAEIALVQRGNLALRLAQVEEQLLLVRGGAHLHERPRTKDVLLYRRLDPPHGVGSEPKALFGFEPLDRLHQADIAFRDHLGYRQAVAAIAHGDLGHEPEMAGNKVMCRVAIVMLAPALGEHVLLLGFQHGKFADLGEVPGKA